MERFNSLAGFRGLKDPAVRKHFSNTFIAFEKEGWGPNQELMMNLDVGYEVTYVGAGAAPNVILARLERGLPSLFFLWTPHPLNSRFRTNRIALPDYRPDLFEKGRSDYPTDVLEKVASKKLGEFAPDVAKFYARFPSTTLRKRRS